MIKKIAVGAAIVAGVVGIGTAAMATSGSLGATAGSGTTSSAAAPAAGAHAARHPKLRALAGRGLHGQVVTKGKGGTGFVTHDFVRGEVTGVSATSISVKAADGVTEQYAVTSSTKVRVRSNGTGKAGSISDVHNGAKVLVVGTGTTSLTATGVVVAG